MTTPAKSVENTEAYLRDIGNKLAQDSRKRENRIIALQCASSYIAATNGFGVKSTIVAAKEFEKYLEHGE